MGIISNYRKQNRRTGPYKEPTKKESTELTSKILDLSYLQKMVDNVLKFHYTKEPKKTIEGYRTWSYVQQFRLQNLLGHVDTPTFVFMLESMLEWCIDCRTSIQPNGKWELCSYEQSIEVVETSRNRTVGKDADGRAQTVEVKEDVQFLVIGLQLVDVNGKNDVVYEMGRITNQSDSNITPKMLKELINAKEPVKAVANDNAEITKYKQAMKTQQEQIANQDAQLIEMKQQMTTMQDMMAGLITELQTARNSAIVEEKPTPKKRGK